MESALKSLMSSSARSLSSMARKPYPSTNDYTSHHATNVPSFPRAPAPPQPPLLPLPAQAPSPQQAFWPVMSRPAPRAKKPRCHAAPSPKMSLPGASVPITVAAPSRKRVAPAATEREAAVEWTGTDSLYSVSPPPSSVPMPTSLLVTVTAARNAPTACAVEVAGGGAGVVDVGATDELRRLLRL